MIRPPPGTYRAPSWSWASLDGPICGFEHFDFLNDKRGADITYDFDSSCQLLHAETTLSALSDDAAAEANPFGPVSAGHVRLRARMTRVVWFRNSTNGFFSGYGWRHGESADRWGPARRDADGHQLPGDDRLIFDVDVVDEWPVGGEIVFWCLEVCTFAGLGSVMDMSKVELFNDRGASTVLYGRGLLLVEVDRAAATDTGPKTGADGVPTFRRVGAIRFQGLPKGDAWFDRWPYWFDDGKVEWREVVII